LLSLCYGTLRSNTIIECLSPKAYKSTLKQKQENNSEGEKSKNKNFSGSDLSLLVMNLLMQLFSELLKHLTPYVHNVLLSSDPNQFLGTM